MHWYWVDVVWTGYGLKPGKLIFKRFVSLRKNQGYSFCSVCRSTLKWTGFCPNLSPHPHVILHAGLARSCRIHCFKKRRKTFSLAIRGPCQDGWGILKRGSSPNLNQRLRRTPLSRRTRVIPGIMDSATSPSAPRRMTRWEANYEDWRFSDLKNQSKGRGNLVLCL